MPSGRRLGGTGTLVPAGGVTGVFCAPGGRATGGALVTGLDLTAVGGGLVDEPPNQPDTLLQNEAFAAGALVRAGGLTVIWPAGETAGAGGGFGAAESVVAGLVEAAPLTGTFFW